MGRRKYNTAKAKIANNLPKRANIQIPSSEPTSKKKTSRKSTDPGDTQSKSHHKRVPKSETRIKKQGQAQVHLCLPFGRFLELFFGFPILVRCSCSFVDSWVLQVLTSFHSSFIHSGEKGNLGHQPRVQVPSLQNKRFFSSSQLG